MVQFSFAEDKNVSCVKMGSNESHFNISLLVRGKVIKTVSVLKPQL